MVKKDIPGIVGKVEENATIDLLRKCFGEDKEICSGNNNDYIVKEGLKRVAYLSYWSVVYEN